MLLLFITVSNYNEIYSFKKVAKSAAPTSTAQQAPQPPNPPVQGEEEERKLFHHELYSQSPQRGAREAGEFDDVLFDEEKKGKKYFDSELPDKELAPRVRPAKDKPARPDDHSLEI